MKLNPKNLLQLFKQAGTDWTDDHAPQLGASLAFYTIFSLAPLLTIVITVASLWFSNNASTEIFNQLGATIGEKSAKFLQDMLVQDPGKQKSGLFTAISAGVMLVFGATGVFVQLQDALNQIWEVKPKPGQGVMGFIRHRLLSFAMVLGIAFILLVSLLLTAAISGLGKYVGGLVGNAQWLIQGLNMVVSFGLVALLFALMFKYVPDAEVSWKDVWAGAIFTSILFSIGKFALGMYLAHNALASSYGAAGALIVVLMWVYYTAQIVFFGAELTQEYAEMAGRHVVPSPHAEWDAEKRCKSEAAAGTREREKAVKEKKEKGSSGAKPALQPAYAMAAAGAAPGSVSGTQAHSTKRTIGGLLLLLFVLIPFEKKLFGSKV